MSEFYQVLSFLLVMGLLLSIFWLQQKLSKVSPLKKELDYVKSALENTQKAASEKHESYLQLFNFSRDGYVINKGSGELLSPNPAFIELVGYSEDELMGLSWYDLTPKETLEWEIELCSKQLSERGYTDLYEKEFIRKDGTRVPVQVQSYLLNDPDRFDESLVAAFARDISDLKAFKRKVATSEDVFNTVFSAIPDLFFLLDNEHTIVDFRAGAVEDLYLPPEQFLGKSMMEVLPPEVTQKLHNATMRSASTGQMMSVEYDLDMDGQTKYYEARVNTLASGDNTVMVVREISDRKAFEDKILHQAHYDSLTQLPNRSLVMDRLDQLLRESKRKQTHVAVIFLDLDDFKKVNDSLGHEEGDFLLQEAANRLTGAVREGDTVARIGGDEFIVLVQDLKNATDVQTVIDGIISSFRKPFILEGHELSTTCSVGVAISGVNGDAPSELLRNADAAMYHAKNSGRNTFSYFTQEMNQAVARKLELELHLPKALENEEFEVFYQPQFDTKTRELIGAEALLRWDNQELGKVSPGEFIPVAEQTGLIVDIGKFVLKQALIQQKKWAEEFGVEVNMSVNLSPRQFREPDLVQYFNGLIERFGFGTPKLKLEITEGVLLTGGTNIEEALTELQEIGVQLSMDDFGTGYSSLSYLRNFPFKVVKIDCSFIRDITYDDADRKLIAAAIAMAHSLDMTVIAEGVETEEQMALLKDMGCDQIQGFLLGKPEPVTNWAQFFKKPDSNLVG